MADASETDNSGDDFKDIKDNIKAVKEKKRKVPQLYDVWEKYTQEAQDQFLEHGNSIISTLEPPDDCILLGMSKDIWDLAQNEKQTLVDFATKINVWRSYSKFFQDNCPGYGLFPIGSTLNGFGLKSSGVDFNIIAFVDRPRSRKYIINKLKLTKRHMGFIRRVLQVNVFVTNLLRVRGHFYHLTFQESFSNLKVSMILNTFYTIMNTHLLFYYTKVDWRVQPLGIILKLFGQSQGLFGTKISSFTCYHLMLLLIYFLQCKVKPAILPNLQKLYPKKFPSCSKPIGHRRFNFFEKFEPKFTNNNNQKLENLLLGFFNFVCDFNFERNVISIRLGTAKPVFGHLKSIHKNLRSTYDKSFLKLEEPFKMTNAAALVDKKDFCPVLYHFRRGAEKLLRTNDIYSLFKPL